MDNYVALDKETKRYILNDFADEWPTSSFYYEYHRKNLSDELDSLLKRKNCSKDNLVSDTVQSKIWFSADENSIIATFDYMLLPQSSDEILAIRFDKNQKISSMVHES